MSMELHVFCDRRLNSIAEWQHAIDAEGFQLLLAGDVDLATASGMLPATLEGGQTGFESYYDDALKTMRFLGVSHFTHFWKYALGLRWGADLLGLEAAWMAATAYAAATGGIIFDHQEGKVFTVKQSRDLIAKFIDERPRIKAFLDNIERRYPKKP
jgi:hypothetical protein